MENQPLPICRQCRKRSVLADAGILKSIPFYFCRPCKIEVDDLGYPVTKRSVQALDELNDYLADAVAKLPDPEYIDVPEEPFGSSWFWKP